MEKNYKIPWVISDFRRKVDKINALLGYHADFMQFLHDALEFELLSMSLNKHWIKGKVIPLQARCGPEGG